MYKILTGAFLMYKVRTGGVSNVQGTYRGRF